MANPTKPGGPAKQRGEETVSSSTPEESGAEVTTASAGKSEKTKAEGQSGWDPACWARDGGSALSHIESSLPGSVPVAFGAGALAVVGVLEWPVAVGGACLYGAYRWFRST